MGSGHIAPHERGRNSAFEAGVAMRVEQMRASSSLIGPRGQIDCFDTDGACSTEPLISWFGVSSYAVKGRELATRL